MRGEKCLPLDVGRLDGVCAIFFSIFKSFFFEQKGGGGRGDFWSKTEGICF